MTVPVTDQPKASTPEPVLKAAASWGVLVPFIVSAVGVLVGVGVLSNEQAELINNITDYITANLVPVGAVVIGLSSLVSGVLGSFTTAAVGRRKVTPVPENKAVD